MDQLLHTAAGLAIKPPCPHEHAATGVLARPLCTAIILAALSWPASAATTQTVNETHESSLATTRSLADDASPGGLPQQPTAASPLEGSAVAIDQAGISPPATGGVSSAGGIGSAASNAAAPGVGSSAGPSAASSAAPGVASSAGPGVGSSAESLAAQPPQRHQPPQARQLQQTPKPPRQAGAAPAWDGLNASQQQWLAPLAGVWHELPSSDRHAWIQLSRQLPRLSQQAQAQARERMQQWSAFTPQQRQAARENFRLAQKLNETSLTQGQLQALWDRYQELTPEQRAVLRAAGQTATTAARHAGAATPLAKEASRPLPLVDRHGRMAQ